MAALRTVVCALVLVAGRSSGEDPCGSTELRSIQAGFWPTAGACKALIQKETTDCSELCRTKLNRHVDLSRADKKCMAALGSGQSVVDTSAKNSVLSADVLALITQAAAVGQGEIRAPPSVLSGRCAVQRRPFSSGRACVDATGTLSAPGQRCFASPPYYFTGWRRNCLAAHVCEAKRGPRVVRTSEAAAGSSGRAIAMTERGAARSEQLPISGRPRPRCG